MQGLLFFCGLLFAFCVDHLDHASSYPENETPSRRNVEGNFKSAFPPRGRKSHFIDCDVNGKTVYKQLLKRNADNASAGSTVPFDEIEIKAEMAPLADNSKKQVTEQTDSTNPSQSRQTNATNRSIVDNSLTDEKKNGSESYRKTLKENGSNIQADYHEDLEATKQSLRKIWGDEDATWIWDLDVHIDPAFLSQNKKIWQEIADTKKKGSLFA